MTATELPETKAYLRLPADLLYVKSDSGIAVRAGAAAIMLQGDDARRVVDMLFPMLDGTRTESEIIDALPGIAPADVKDLLRDLQDHGLLSREQQPDPGRPVAAERFARLQAAKVLLTGDAHRTASAAAAIRAAGVGAIRSSLQDLDGVDIAVGLFDEREPQQGIDFASRLHAAGIPTLICITGGAISTIGPLSILGRTACWNCGRLRLQANGARNAEAGQCDDAERPAHTVDQHLAGAVRDALCLGDGSPLINHVLICGARSARTSLHPVLPAPQCRVCGGPAGPRRAPHESHQQGSHDDAMFDLSLRMLSRFVDDRTGIVNRVVIETADDTGLELPVIATAITAAAPDGASPAQPMPVGWGKGTNAAEAVVGAIGEAIERYAGSMPDPERIVWSPPDRLAGEVLHPREFALYTDEQFECPEFPYVRFDPNVAHPWIAGEWASTRRSVWVPAGLVFLSLEMRRAHAFCQGTSNGMAAGTEASEAELRAILELLERDAFMTSWLCRRPGRALRVDGTLEPNLQIILDGAAALGAHIELVLLDSACGYPTVACLGFGDGINWPGVTFGLGTDPDARNAARQAILEFGQTGPYLRKMMIAAPDLIPKTASAVSEMLDHARYYFAPDRARAFEYLRNGSDICALADLPKGPERSLRACAEALEASNLRVALVDVTSADVATTDFVVIRAVSPDLQPISFGHGLDRMPIPRLKALGAKTPDISPIW